MKEKKESSMVEKAQEFTIPALIALLTYIGATQADLFNRSSKQSETADKIISTQVKELRDDLNKLEIEVTRDATILNAKIDNGFESIRAILREGTKDRFTKADHGEYKAEQSRRFERNEDRLGALERAIK